MSTIDLFVILSALLALYGIFKYHQAEKNDYAEIVDRVKTLQGDMKILERNFNNTSSGHAVDLTTQSAKLKDLQKQIDDLQEHVAKLRGSYMKLRDRVVAKPRKIEVMGAIPVEVMGPSKPPAVPKQLKKIKKQIDSLSK